MESIDASTVPRMVGLIIEKSSAIRVARLQVCSNITKSISISISSIKPPIRPTRDSYETQVSHVCQPRVGIFKQELPTKFIYITIVHMCLHPYVYVYKAHRSLSPSLLHFDTRFRSQPPSLLFIIILYPRIIIFNRRSIKKTTIMIIIIVVIISKWS